MMLKKSLLAVTALGVIAVPTTASAEPGDRVWSDWSKPSHHVKTRYDQMMPGPGRPEVFQFRRSGGHGKVRVRLTWAYGDISTSTPPPTAASSKWKKVAPGRTVLLKSADKQCNTMLTVWPQLSVRRHGHWSASRPFGFRHSSATYWDSVMPITGC